MFGRTELWLYLLTSRIVGGKLIQKLKAGAQQVGIPPDRFQERLGQATKAKTLGRLVWLHARDTSSALLLFRLIEQLNEQELGLNFLVTTRKQETVEVLLEQLPENTIHQYLPIDLRKPIREFLKHWQPDVAVISDGDFWPRFLTVLAKQKTPLIAINTRMTQKNYHRWRWLPGLAKSVFNKFDLILAQDQQVAKKLKWFGVQSGKIRVTGVMSEMKELLYYDEALYANLSAAFGTRSVWLSAVTHRAEEDVIVNAHKLAMRRNRRLLLILHTREKNRGTRIAARHENQNLTFALQQNGDVPDDATDVFVTDRQEDLATYLRLASVSFCGGSLSTGQTIDPFHPASMGSAMIHGAAYGEYAQDYDRYHGAGASRLVSNGGELAETLNRVIAPDEAALMANAAWEISSEGGEVSGIVIAEILEKLAQGNVDAAA
jgi:3-deoxy-D-manno-octulosonic-acid transferase